MKDNDLLKFTSPIRFTITLGLLGIFTGAVILYAALEVPMICGASVLAVPVIMLIGILMFLLRRFHEIDRRNMTEAIYLGMIIPLRGTSRNLFRLNQRSIKSFNRVTVQHQETYISPEPGIDPGGSISEYHVGLANDQTEIRLATFDSLASAEKHAEDIEKFLYSD